jgi:hypothetical protein
MAIIRCMGMLDHDAEALKADLPIQQTSFSDVEETASVRSDVDSTAWVPAKLIPNPERKYLDSYEYTL